MTDNDDLATRLLAAIEETERIARAAGDDALGWLTGWVEISSPEVDAAIAHFGRHETDKVLRHCAADRRVVERHSPRWLEPGYGHCAWCGQTWPCPDFQDRMAAYDITAEETTHG